MARLGSRTVEFAPADVAETLDKLSKNDLIDLVWTITGMTVESAEDVKLVKAAIAQEVYIHAMNQKEGMRFPQEMHRWNTHLTR